MSDSESEGEPKQNVDSCKKDGRKKPRSKGRKSKQVVDCSRGKPEESEETTFCEYETSKDNFIADTRGSTKRTTKEGIIDSKCYELAQDVDSWERDRQYTVLNIELPFDPEEEFDSVQPIEKLPTDTNPFSEPWEDSDLVLVVESEKFHVHRLVLILNSPVFKAMLQSDFKDAKSAEIPLPMKDPIEVLDLMKQLYPQVRAEITMANVEYLLKLADEYQMTSVLDLCASFLRMERKRESNAMEILLLAQRYKLDNLTEDCCNVLAKMTLKDLEEYDEFEELDGKNLREILLPRMRKLEKKDIKLKPQVAGLLACATWLWSEAKRRLPWCPVHYKGGKSYGNLEARLRDCDACKNVIQCFIDETCLGKYTDNKNEKVTDDFLPVLKQLFDLTDDEDDLPHDGSISE